RAPSPRGRGLRENQQKYQPGPLPWIAGGSRDTADIGHSPLPWGEGRERSESGEGFLLYLEGRPSAQLSSAGLMWAQPSTSA
ncbi:MAG: hypothetical protein LAP13_12710, partial [Acidobacteriia bacterium]|nr:hypothetical protein [Terriglobia bacterium]